MDFLDPKEKRKRGIRLAIGYSLMLVLVAFATLVMVFQAYGFDLDRRGRVVQNGLVFFDSVPDGANITINGEEQSRRTNVRMSLAEGKYDITLSKDGYQPWTKSVLLEGGHVERFYYPLLLPQKLTTTEIQRYDKTPGLTLQSPDRRWVLVERPGATGRFIRYDLNSLGDNNRPASENINFPSRLFKTATGPRTLKTVEWSADNKHVLLRHVYSGGSEYVVLNHDEPSESFNLNNTLPGQLGEVTLRDNKYDKYYIHSMKNNTLSTAELGSPTQEKLLSDVLAYKSHGGKDLLYSKLSPDKKNIHVVLRLGDDEYVLREIGGRPKVLLDLASFDGDWFPAYSVSDEKKAYIYKNPQDFISSNDGAKPAPIMVLKLNLAPQSLRFSQNASKVMVNNGQEFSVYDVEFDHPYRFMIQDKFDEGNKPVWMDGHRLVNHSGGRILVFEFDGENKRKLVPALDTLPAMFDGDYERLYSIGDSKDQKNKKALVQTNLRIDADLSGGLFN